MPPQHFVPWLPLPRPCWHCHWYQGLAPGPAGLCARAGAPRVRSQPAHGCSAFEREPGTDDDPASTPDSIAIMLAPGMETAPDRR